MGKRYKVVVSQLSDCTKQERVRDLKCVHMVRINKETVKYFRWLDKADKCARKNGNKLEDIKVVSVPDYYKVEDD